MDNRPHLGVKPLLMSLLLCAGSQAAPALANPPRNISCGATITVPRTPPDWRAARVKCPPNRPITYDASGRTLRTGTIRGAEGVRLRGGTFDGQGVQGPALTIDNSRFVTVIGVTTTRAVVGITVVRSTDVVLADNQLTGLQSDGINFAQVQRLRMERNKCLNFRPVLPVFRPDGTMLKDGNHPDCMQGWSVPGTPATSDITAIGNVATGFMQGFGIYNRGTQGVDRVTLKDNVFHLSTYNGVYLYDARDSVVTRNQVTTIPGARGLNPPRFPAVVTWIRVLGASTGVVCGNIAPSDPQKFGTRPCR